MFCKGSISSARSSTSIRSAATSASTRRARSTNRRSRPASTPSSPRVSAIWTRPTNSTCARRAGPRRLQPRGPRGLPCHFDGGVRGSRWSRVSGACASATACCRSTRSCRPPWESSLFKVNFRDRVLTVRITRVHAVEVANEGAPVELEIRGVRRLIADKVIMNCEL